MSLSDISLTAGMRTNLSSLQSTATLLARTQERLSTGKKVNTALDNPTNFFAAANHTQRASDLTSRKDGMSEAIQGVSAANKGISNITALIESAKGLTTSALISDTAGRNILAAQFNTVLAQMTTMANDSNYKGKNFLGNDTLSVLFNETGSANLTISGFDATATGMGVNAVGITQITSGIVGTTTTVGYNTIVKSLHTATLNTALPAGTLETSKFSIQSSGASYANANSFRTGQSGAISVLASGVMTFEISGVANLLGGNTFTGGSGMFTGSLHINSVMVDGVTFYEDGSIGTTGSAEYSGRNTANFTAANAIALVAHFNAQIEAGNPLTGNGQVGMASGSINLTGVNEMFAIYGTTGTVGINTASQSLDIRLDITAARMSRSGQSVPASNLVYDFQAGDGISGVQALSGYITGSAGVGTDGHSRIAGLVNVDGSWLTNTGFGFFNGGATGNKIVFNGGAGPAPTSVTYWYNDGFVTGAVGTSTQTGVQAAQVKVFTGQNLSATQQITEVYINGAKLTGGYAVSGNVISLDSALANGAHMTYKMTNTVAGGWDSNSGIEDSVAALNSAVTTLRTQATSMASNLSVVTIRQDFTDQMIQTLQKGADNLTLADMNEEGANMLMLQTRQQLSTTSLKMASDTASSVLRLF